MTKPEFKKIVDRIGHAYRDPFTEGQFDEWYEGFKDEDYLMVDRAVTIMTGPEGYKYFPVKATLWEYIKKAKDIIEAKPETEKSKSQMIAEWTPEFRDQHKRWARYFRWIVESKEYPKTHKEVAELKAKFEKERPDWQPKVTKVKKQMQPIGDILSNAL